MYLLCVLIRYNSVDSSGLNIRYTCLCLFWVAIMKIKVLFRICFVRVYISEYSIIVFK